MHSSEALRTHGIWKDTLGDDFASKDAKKPMDTQARPLALWCPARAFVSCALRISASHELHLNFIDG